MDTKPRGGGVKALVVGPLKKKNFFVASPMVLNLFLLLEYNYRQLFSDAATCIWLSFIFLFIIFPLNMFFFLLFFL